MEQHVAKTCQCHKTTPMEAKLSDAAVKKTARSAPSILLGFLIAFFPKCPICWAAYMSMFGSFGLAKTPYIGWLFPVLIGFLGLHLLLLLKKAPQKGYGPFLISLAGALLIVCARSLFPDEEWLLVSGMLFIFSGSLWSSFSVKKFKASPYKLF